jgi:hypothetical protein
MHVTLGINVCNKNEKIFPHSNLEYTQQLHVFTGYDDILFYDKQNFINS